ncbi:MAG: hypothetical protein ACYTGA_10945 [Planctomycetota bacterium]
MKYGRGESSAFAKMGIPRANLLDKKTSPELLPKCNLPKILSTLHTD